MYYAALYIFFFFVKTNEFLKYILETGICILSFTNKIEIIVIVVKLHSIVSERQT